MARTADPDLVGIIASAVAGDEYAFARLAPYSPGVTRLRSAFELASGVAGLRLILGSTLGDCYRVRDRDDGAVVCLWRR